MHQGLYEKLIPVAVIPDTFSDNGWGGAWNRSMIARCGNIRKYRSARGR
jgi:hypothetical protein